MAHFPPLEEQFMSAQRLRLGLLALLLCSPGSLPAANPLPILDDRPTPQVDAGGPSAAVTALAFSSDGQTLYAAGLDKLVRVWTLQQGQFKLKATYHVPIGPGNAGSLNAVALSPDGAWLAMAGRAPMRGEAGFRRAGVIVEAAALSPEQLADAGLIYVASTANPAGGKVLRGHHGEVRALAFAPAYKDKPPLLLSAATERAGERRFGGLRLWDAASGQLLAQREDLPARITRPGLALWHTGPAVRQVRVAITWPEPDVSQPSSLRLWDLGPATEARQGWETDRYTQTVAFLGTEDGGRLLTGGLEVDAQGQPGNGRLLAWHLSTAPNNQAQFDAVIPFPLLQGVRTVPVCLTVWSPQGLAAPQYAAAILQPAAAADFRLALVDLKSGRVLTEVPLTGSDRQQLPTLAARENAIAVAATANHSIRVYALADLLRGNPQPRIVLANHVWAPRQVAFVDQGRGVWLSEQAQAPPRTGGWVFDLAQRQLRPNEQGNLADDTPDLGNWSVVLDPDRKGVQVQQGAQSLPPVRLRGKDEYVTAMALRPPGPGRAGVLALAYTERGANRVLIQLSDPMQGKPYRLLVSHLQDVRGLAFSANRNLLASVADDQTICVWSLADIDQAVGQVAGLGVQDAAGGQVVVNQVEQGSAAAQAGLAVGDSVTQLGVAGGPLKPVKDAAGLLLAIAARRPAETVQLTIAGKGNLPVPVTRGVDQRKPLFSLLFTRTGGNPGWIGWSPAGPYDASSLAIEQQLGWHTNTGDPAAPVSFAAAPEYRKEYLREGILRYLAADSDLGRALRDWDRDHPLQPPQPALRPMRPTGALPGERTNEYLVRQPVKIVRIGINEDYPLDEQHILRWRLARTDGGSVQGNTGQAIGQGLREGREWQIDLSGVSWRSGAYQLRVGLFARAAAPELAADTLTLQYQTKEPTPPAPPPVVPKVVIAPLATPDLVTDHIALRGSFQSLPETFGLRLRVTATNGQVRSTVAGLDRQAGHWTAPLTLFPGNNSVEVLAVSKAQGEQVLAGPLALQYRRPPRITVYPREVEAVETNKVKLTVTVEGPAERPLIGFTVDQAPVPFSAGQPRVQGERASWQVELPEVFVNDGDHNLDTVRLRAISEEGESQPAAIHVVHKQQPRPPLARFLSPTGPDTSRQAAYEVAYRVESERPLQRVEIRRADTVLYQADLTKGEREGALYVLSGKAVVTLQSATNVLELLAVNADGRSPRAEVVVSYVEPAVLVLVDRVEILDDQGRVQQQLTPQHQANGDFHFPVASRSFLWLTGRVRWSDPQAPALTARNLEVLARVGDCRQFPVLLGPRAPGDQANVRSFRVPLVLIGPNNRIRVEVQSVGQQELSSHEFDLDCAAPARNQRLHLLIVGVNVTDAVRLKNRILDALDVDSKNRPLGSQGEFFRKPPFERCVLYHVLAGEVDRGQVEAQLVEINHEIIRLQQATGWLNDVVLIYYQGEDIVLPDRRQRWLKTSRNYQFPQAPSEVFAVPCHALPRVAGAQLLLLNVSDGARTGQASDWGGPPDASLVRYAHRLPSEGGTPDPTLLRLLQEAIQRASRVGDVVQTVNRLLGQQPSTWSPYVVLDEDLARRRIGPGAAQEPQNR
jgi:WD40 repeat protein